MTDTEPSAARRTGLVAGFTVSVGFLTRIPIAAPADWRLADCAWAFPLVGAGIGVVAALTFLAAQLIGLGDWPSALLALLSGMLLTGALHEDGLADAADGLFGGSDLDRRLAIMRDSRVGAFAVLALLMSVGLRGAALAQIGEVVSAGLALIAAHAGSRGLLGAAMWAMRPARGDGLGADAGRPSAAAAAIAVLVALAICGAALGPARGAVALLAAAAAVAAAGTTAKRRIGGYTGDVLGAFQQIGEIVILLTAAAR